MLHTFLFRKSLFPQGRLPTDNTIVFFEISLHDAFPWLKPFKNLPLWFTLIQLLSTLRPCKVWFVCLSGPMWGSCALLGHCPGLTGLLSALSSILSRKVTYRFSVQLFVGFLSSTDNSWFLNILFICAFTF